MANQVETHLEIITENRDRASVFFRWLLALPVVVLLSLFDLSNEMGASTLVFFIPVILTILIRQVYPSWVLTFNHAILEFSMRIASYALFLTDKYPTLEANSSVAVILPDIEGGKKLNRWLPLVKWFLAIPLYLVGLLYLIYAALATITLWVQISITGKGSKWAFDAVNGTLKFWNRVLGYAILLVSDEYPTFSLN
ncbi:MAG: hypothetical protein ACKO8C_02605 [Candidatus Nanopelagicaceae bacterium]